MFTRTKRTELVAIALVLLAGLVPIGAAQDESHRDTVDVVSNRDDELGTSVEVEHRNPERVDVVSICPPSSSRVAAACARPTSETVIRVEKESSSEIEVPPLPEPPYCEATIAIAYTQRVTIARVEGTIRNPDCAASSGSYVLGVSTRDESGELKTREYTGSWQRDDDRPVTFIADYRIGENVDLVRVRPHHLLCACARTPEN